MCEYQHKSEVQGHHNNFDGGQIAKCNVGQRWGTKDCNFFDTIKQLIINIE